ncbi:hypothetical protein C8Q76DRAFT_697703 [Earliella scabrosa]|nr:hypothetical protein C8Q76DRAFT_697703 [Earliella scabrosa]
MEREVGLARRRRAGAERTRAQSEANAESESEPPASGMVATRVAASDASRYGCASEASWDRCHLCSRSRAPNPPPDPFQSPLLVDVQPRVLVLWHVAWDLEPEENRAREVEELVDKHGERRPVLLQQDVDGSLGGHIALVSFLELDERLSEGNVGSPTMSVGQAIVTSRGASHDTENLGWVVEDPPEALLKDERLSVEPT